jgi:peptidoglycan/LPS O-acetylase OafA/YrhL
MKRDQIPSLTGLRFIAAFSVAFSHAVLYIFPPPTPGWSILMRSAYDLAVSAAGLGMPLFFVLSGFVIHYNYSAKIQSGSFYEVLNFFAARFSRLYPLYLCVLVFSVLTTLNTKAIPPSALAYHVLMLQSWFYTSYGDKSLIYSLGPSASILWSVSTEWFFYVVYPPICFLLTALTTHRSRMIAAVGLLISALALISLAVLNIDAINSFGGAIFGPIAESGPYGQNSFFRWLVYFSPYSRISEFLLGCFVASLYLNRSETKNTSGFWLTSLAALLIAATYFAFFGLDRFPWFHTLGILHMSFGLAPGIALLIYCCACYDNPVTKALRAPWLVICGEASYSLYLLHIIVVECFQQDGSPLRNLRVLGISLLSCISLSILSWRFVEMPARNWLRSKLTRRAAKFELARSSVGNSARP